VPVRRFRLQIACCAVAMGSLGPAVFCVPQVRVKSETRLEHMAVGHKPAREATTPGVSRSLVCTRWRLAGIRHELDANGELRAPHCRLTDGCVDTSVLFLVLHDTACPVVQSFFGDTFSSSDSNCAALLSNRGQYYGQWYSAGDSLSLCNAYYMGLSISSAPCSELLALLLYGVCTGRAPHMKRWHRYLLHRDTLKVYTSARPGFGAATLTFIAEG
jgi:hypothetical protein